MVSIFRGTDQPTDAERAADCKLARLRAPGGVPLRDDALVALFMAGRGAFQGDPSSADEPLTLGRLGSR
jgi:hypothetical protein